MSTLKIIYNTGFGIGGQGFEGVRFFEQLKYT